MERCKGKQNPTDIRTAVENKEDLGQHLSGKMHVILKPKCHRSCRVAGEMIKEIAAKSCREQQQEFKSQNKTCENSTEEVNVIAVKKTTENTQKVFNPSK